MSVALKLLTVASVYVVADVLMYRERVLSSGSPWDADSVVFILPAVMALVANGWVLGKALPASWRGFAKVAVASALAGLFMLVAVGMFAVVAFNIYGT